MPHAIARKQNQDLALPISALKGIGPGRAKLFAEKGLYTILDLLLFTPLRYEDRRQVYELRDLREGTAVMARGHVVSGGEAFFPRTRKRLFRILLRDDRNSLELLWFQYRKPHLVRFCEPGTELWVYGTPQQNRGVLQMLHPDVTVMGQDDGGWKPGFYPVYSQIKGISNQGLRKVMRQALEQYSAQVQDPLPPELIAKRGFPGLDRVIEHLHFPDERFTLEQLNQGQTPYHRRLIFERFFWVMSAIAFRKLIRQKQGLGAFSIPADMTTVMDKTLPFNLTSDQVRALEEIKEDFCGAKPMNRLLLGDVGCGKTVVAALAAYIAVANRFQAALMAPTQILAQQHFEYFTTLSRDWGFKPVLLLSSLKKAEREDLSAKISNGEYNLMIGTHALIQEPLTFSRLGLVIIDEQHRFGVRARALLDRKGRNPHVLVMSATPIPRSLAMTVYGDLEASVIHEFPKGRLARTTRLGFPKDKVMVLETLKQRLASGQQAFVVCPMIEASEDSDLKNAIETEEKLKKLLAPRFCVGLVHGRLASEEREKAMEKFRSGQLDVLVGTTVIEVGIHVPGASMMIIEQAERFGLAQLHQLRGRIGRGREPGLCYLMTAPDISQKARERLEILTQTDDGFVIAQKDLELRGQGELLGLRQTGIGDLDLRDILREPELLQQAKEAAEALVQADPQFTKPEHAGLKSYIESILARPLDI